MLQLAFTRQAIIILPGFLCGVEDFGTHKTHVTISAFSAHVFNRLISANWHILQDGFTSITSDDFSRGNASTETFWEGDGVEILEYRDAHYSPFFSGSSCGRVEFASNYSTITAFLLTKNKFLEMFHKVSFSFGPTLKMWLLCSTLSLNSALASHGKTGVWHTFAYLLKRNLSYRLLSEHLVYFTRELVQ